MTTTRAHVHYVFNEYAVVKNYQQRAKALIDIEALEHAAYERFQNIY